MADTKITALAAITTVDPAADVLPIVDISDTSMAASGTTKKITSNQILGAGGTATLASATITGDLTVDTNVLKVDTTLNRVGINNASPSQALDVAGSIYLSTNATYLYGKTSGGLATRTFGLNAANDVYVGSIDQSISNIRFNSGGVDLMILNSTANLVLKGGTAGANGVGVTFPADQVASSDANCLDDYEEGTWTGTLTGGTTNPTTPVTATGRYTKIGRQVSIQIQFTNVDTTGASGQIQVSGAPFTNNSSTSSIGSVLLSSIGTFTGSPAVFIGTSSSLIELYASSSGGAAAFVTHNAGASRSLYINLTYTV